MNVNNIKSVLRNFRILVSAGEYQADEQEMSRGSPGEYQADEQAGVAGLSW